MGRIVAPFGVKGWVKVSPLTVEAPTLLTYRTWWLRPRAASSGWQEHELESGRVAGANLLVRFADIVDREAAAQWSGADVGVPREALPAVAEGEIYWSDLLGLAVVTRQGLLLGQVAAVEDFGAHPVMRVVDEAGLTRLIPYVDAWVNHVDIAARRIEVDWQADY